MFVYLACENEKDRVRNMALNNPHIESTIQNRRVVQQECKKRVIGTA